MPIPEAFYYQEPSSLMDYTDRPSGNLDIDKFLAAEAKCFVDVTSKNKKKPKNLIIADWRAFIWPFELLEQLEKQLEVLLEDGFKIYLWQKGGLIKELHNTQTINSLRREITPAPPKLVLSSAFKQHTNLTHDNTLLLNDYWIDKLIDPKMPLKHIVSIHIFGDLLAEEQAIVIEQLRNSKLDIDILIDSIEGFGGLAFLKLKDAFPNAILNYSFFFNIGWFEDGIKRLANQNKGQQRTLTLFSSNLLSENVDNLEIMNLTKKFEAEWCFFSVNNINQILEKLPHLEQLDLQSCPNLEGFLSQLPAEYDFKNLKKVTINRTNIQAEDLIVLFHKAPNLVELDLHECVIARSKTFVVSASTKSSISRLKKLSNFYEKYCQDEILKELLANKSALLAPAPLPPPQTTFSQFKALFTTNPTATPTMRPRVPEVSSPPSNTLTMDANTHFEQNKNFNVKRYFYSVEEGELDPEISEYRLVSYNQLVLNPKPCTAENAFNLTNDDDMRLRDSVALRIQNDGEDVLTKTKALALLPHQSYAYGKKSYTLDRRWQPLPSLTTQDVLQFYKTTPRDVNIELQFSDRDQLYYIRSMSPDVENFVLEFAIKKPKISPSIPPEFTKVQQLVRDLLEFGTKDLPFLDPKKARGIDYLDSIARHKRGACRHRAILCMETLKRDNIKTRYIENDCHAFVEVCLNNKWIRCDLGGYPAKLSVQEQMPGRPTVTVQTLRDMGSNKYDQLMETWIKKPGKEVPVLPLEFCHHLLHPQREPNKERPLKSLVALGSTDAVTAVVLRLRQMSKLTHKPIFYINSASDLACFKKFLTRVGSRGIIHEGPGGALYDFLTADYSDDNSPILLINYANFSPSEIVALNGLLDPDRRADKIPVPENMHIIGVMDVNAPNAYHGSDFYSRFDRINTDLIKRTSLPEFINQTVITEGRSMAEPERINLYHALDWKAQLLGHWIMDGEGLVFKEGALKQALTRGKTIIIENGPWDDEAFQFIWREAAMLGEIPYQGEVFDTKNIQIIRRDGYNWVPLRLSNRFILDQSLKTEDCIILNPSSISNFFSNYQYDAIHQTLVYGDGFLKNAVERGVLNVYITRSISEDNWARILQFCQEQNIRVQAKLAPNVTLPAELETRFTEALADIAPFTLDGIDEAQIQVIESTDPDTSTLSQRL